MNSFLETFRRLGAARLAMLGGVALITLAFFVYMISRVTEPSMQLLYSELDNQDSQEIVRELQVRGVPHTVSPDGGSISVPADQVTDLRLSMAEQGLPSGGSLGYEIFDRGEGLGTSSFVQNINHVRALEGELARTITAMSGVKNARVHLVLPHRELFSRERNEPSASIALSLEGRGGLSNANIRAVQQLVAAAVPKLTPDSVAIVDADGNLLASTASGDELSNILGTAEERRLAQEDRLSRAAEELLERSLGYGNVRVEVTAEMDYDRITENSEIYDPDGQVARSIQTVEEMSEEGGDEEAVTVGGNLPGAEVLPGEQGGGNSSTRLEETTNFEISRTTRTRVQESGAIRRLSVAVLVNGQPTTNETGETVIEPRSDEELERLGALARSAVGFDAERGDSFEIASMAFAEVLPEGTPASPPNQFFGVPYSTLMEIAQLLVLGAVAVLALLLVVRPLVGRLLTADTRPGGTTSGDLAASLPGLGGYRQPALAGAGGGPAGMLSGPNQDPGLQTYAGYEAQMPAEDEEEAGINVSQVEGALRASSVRKISELAERHPQETVGIIRTWLSQDN